MTFADLDRVPERLETPEFVLRPLVAADVEMDYAAVMSSVEQLGPWEQTGWPADDFTVADDLVDVEMLEKRHREGRALTYTVLTPDEAECLGCVYLMAPDASTFEKAEISGEAWWDELRAAVYFWVVTSRLVDGLELRLLDALRSWFADEWHLDRYVVVTNEQCAHQLATLHAAGLERRFTIVEPGKAPYLAFAPAPRYAAGEASGASPGRSVE